jgi:protein phosphatase
MNGSDTLINRYLWAAEPAVAEISPGRLIQDRYEVVAPQIWRDTQPEFDPYVPQELPDEILPYLYLYPQRLHIPEVYGWAVLGEAPETAEVVLLDNVPIDADGDLYPAIEQEWSQASAVRQVYWLWQIFQLWGHLSEQGVASSLLVADNIRVQGGRVWLLQLFADAVGVTEESGGEGEISPLTPSLKHLGDRWMQWSQTAQASVTDRLQEIAVLLGGDEVELDAIATQLNQLLLEEAAQIPLRLQVAGATDTGPQRAGNEDACYPKASDLEDIAAQPNDLLIPHLTLVCDGIGGHEGGEVASSLALQTLKLQVRALLVEIAAQTHIVSPTLVMEQISAIIRVVNNMIASQNDTQGRESRARMATTLVMALQLPQKIRKSDGSELGNAHELYIANVGDSRAYWITADYCQQLTLDDDVATREVRLGRALYREALKRADAGALTQALGTRDGELLHPTIHRLIVEEDGLLLLCSDGLSDRNLVEESWKEFAKPVLKGKLSTEAAVQSWINLANEKNGHDNTSVVLTCCLVSKEPPALFEPKQVTTEVQTPRTRLESELTAASRALLYDESGVIQQREPILVTPNKNWGKVLGLLALLLLVGVAGYAAWVTSKPQTSPQPEQSLPSPQ